MAANKKKHGAALITGGSSAIGCELAMEFGARAETLILAFVRLPWPKARFAGDPGLRTPIGSVDADGRGFWQSRFFHFLSCHCKSPTHSRLRGPT